MYRLAVFKNNNIHENEKGFTLIEVLIAIILLSFISLSTFKMVEDSTDTKDRVLAEDQRLLQTLTAVSRIDNDFSQFYSPLFAYSKNAPATNGSAYQDDNSNKANFDGRAKNGALIPQFTSEDKSTLIFFSAANRRKTADAKEGRFAWVKYSVRRIENPDADKKSAGDYEMVRQMITSNLYNQNLNWDQAKTQVLISNIKNVGFSFWDERNKKFVPSVLDLNENRNAIRAVKMDLIWIDENNHEQTISKVYRNLYPYFNPKQDDLAAGGGAYGDSTPPPGVPNPDDPSGQGQGGGQGGQTVFH
jgi:prepilin-type N-terminal cleavage/methylation domain-containing protein